MEISSNSWIGDEFILANHFNKSEKPTILWTIKARSKICALKISCQDFRKSIPKDYLKKMRNIAEVKKESIKNVTDELSPGVEALKEINYNQRTFAKDLDCLMKLYPHLPKKLIIRVSFGDGEKRIRHHIRDSDKIRIGEIAINKDMKITEEEVKV